MLRLVVSNANPAPKHPGLVRYGNAQLQVGFHTRPKLCRLIHTKADEKNKSAKSVLELVSTRKQVLDAIIPHMEAMIEETKLFIEKQKAFIAKSRLRCVKKD